MKNALLAASIFVSATCAQAEESPVFRAYGGGAGFSFPDWARTDAQDAAQTKCAPSSRAIRVSKWTTIGPTAYGRFFLAYADFVCRN